jgi:tripartite motif-containing protein 71
LKFSLTVKDDKGAVSINPATVFVTVAASSPSITPSVSNQTGNATSMTTRENNQTNNATANGYLFKTKWGSYGTADGQFNSPTGVAVDSSGNVYVADNNNSRIQKFDSNDNFITKWGSYGDRSCCSYGLANGQFVYPYDIAVDSSGNVYVVDTYNYRIQKFDSSGTFITKWGSWGTGDGQFIHPIGVAVDSSENVYVTDSFNNRIQVFSPKYK